MSLTFTYRGKDLVKPLTALLARHAEDLRAIDAELAQHAASDVAIAREPTTLTGRAPSVTGNEIRSLDRERLDVLVRRRETELFLFECRRTPRATWVLDMQELAAIYPLPRGAA